jgi:DNA repair exonuclease SbcCD ATPase subunit
MFLIKNYSSIKEIQDTLEEEIAKTRSNLGEYLRSLDEIRSYAEKSKKIREIVMKMANKKNGLNGSNENLGELEVGGLKIVLEANAFHQLTAIESAVRNHQERLLVLQKANEGLKSLSQIGDTDGLNFMVLENNGVPERILLKTA